MTDMVGVGPREFEMRVKRIVITTNTIDGDSIQTKDVLQQYIHSNWEDLKVIEERLHMPFE